MKQREALERQLAALTTKAEKTFRHDGTVHLPKVIVTAVEDGWYALCRQHDHARAETLIQVAALLIAREAAKFKSAPQKYISRQQELAA
jgi:hypothetical protein